jgi:hypothetical protein
MPSQFNAIPSANEELNRVQQNIRAAIDPISKDEILNRTTITISITKPPLFTTATGTFLHSLGREPRGWIVVDKLQNANLWRVSWTKTDITIATSATVDATLILF